MKRRSERLEQLYTYILNHEERESVKKHIRLALWRWHATPTRVFIIMNMRTHKIDWIYATSSQLKDDWYILLTFDGKNGPLPGHVREWYRETPEICYCYMMDKLATEIRKASDEEAYNDWLVAQFSE